MKYNWGAIDRPAYIYNNPCSQYKHTKKSNSFFIILKLFANVNNTILWLLFSYNIQWQVDTIWLRDRLIKKNMLNDSVTSWYRLIKFKVFKSGNLNIINYIKIVMLIKVIPAHISENWNFRTTKIRRSTLPM